MDLNRLCVHTITTKPWTLLQALQSYQNAGVGGISIWQNAIENIGFAEARKMLDDHEIEVVSYVRGGFFPADSEAGRSQAIGHNKYMLDEAAALGAPSLVLVCGAHPGQSLQTSRAQIKQGIEAILPHAEDLEIKLSIEPLHPMYADTRSAINTLAQANDMAEYFDSLWVGVAIDVYHLWWDPDLYQQIERCGQHNNMVAYHICDWKSPTNDMLNDRGLMGEGCIPIREISDQILKAGFDGFHEVEIFSEHYWNMDQENFLGLIVEAFNNIYS